MKNAARSSTLPGWYHRRGGKIGFFCGRCGCNAVDEYSYMLHDDHWSVILRVVGISEEENVRRAFKLCVGCLKWLAGRRLNANDFDWKVRCTTDLFLIRSRRLRQAMTRLIVPYRRGSRVKLNVRRLAELSEIRDKMLKLSQLTRRFVNRVEKRSRLWLKAVKGFSHDRSK